MSTTVASPQVAASITATLTGGAAPAPATSQVNHQFSVQPTVGSSAGNVNKVYSTAVSVDTASASSIDLTSVTDPLGNAVNFGTVTRIMLSNGSTTAGQIVTPFGGSNGVMSTGTQVLNPGGCLLWDGGSVGVTIDGSHKILRLAAAAGSAVPISITVLGQ
jgi:hypothetical protein